MLKTVSQIGIFSTSFLLYLTYSHKTNYFTFMASHIKRSRLLMSRIEKQFCCISWVWMEVLCVSSIQPYLAFDLLGSRSLLLKSLNRDEKFCLSYLSVKYNCADILCFRSLQHGIVFFIDVFIILCSIISVTHTSWQTFSVLMVIFCDHPVPNECCMICTIFLKASICMPPVEWHIAVFTSFPLALLYPHYW